MADTEQLRRALARNLGDYYELMATARKVLPREVVASYERGVAPKFCETCAGTGEPLEAHEADTETRCHMCDGTGVV